MALKLIIVCAVIFAAAEAQFAWTNTFPNFPGFQPINFNFPKIPTYKDIEDMVIKSKSDPNSNYNGVVVKSTSFTSKDSDGNVVKKGGTTVLSENNGESHIVSFGNDPPVIKTSSSQTSPNEIPKVTIPEIKIPQITLPQITIPQVPVFQPFDLLKPVIDAVNTNANSIVASTNGVGGFQSVISNSNGGGGYNSVFSSSNGGGFASSSSSSFSQGSNVNGVTSGGGIASTYYNVNGDSGGKTIIYST